ncbi:MAG: hypothetical protein JG759_411 [Thermoanaerobacter sp.]|jgi:hypothetical protein|nr:hypothetical protein [Thermoanaerobacter sp.]
MDKLMFWIVGGLLFYLYFKIIWKGEDTMVNKDFDTDKMMNLLEYYGYGKGTALAQNITYFIKKYAELEKVDWKLIAGIIAKESSFNIYAVGDYVDEDYYGKHHYASFGLGQIYTTKKKKEEWSTFDFICEYSRSYDIIREFNLNLQEYRDKEVIKAINMDINNVFFKPEVNIFLIARFIRIIMDKHNLDPYDYKRICYHYNVGINARLEGLGHWLLESNYYTTVLETINKLS